MTYKVTLDEEKPGGSPELVLYSPWAVNPLVQKTAPTNKPELQPDGREQHQAASHGAGVGGICAMSCHCLFFGLLLPSPRRSNGNELWRKDMKSDPANPSFGQLLQEAN